MAESLGGNVIAQLNNPGTPVIIGVSPCVMDFRTGIHTEFASEMMVFQAASGQFGDYYDMPIFGMGGCTNAYSMDFQAGLEAAISLYGSVLGGQNLIHDLGFAGRGDLGSLELLTLTDEMVGMLERSIDGMSVNGETLALDVIQNVDHGDNFLAERHTKEHGREALFMPELLDAVEESQWDDNRSVEQARERAKRLLAEAEPDPLPEDVQADLDAKMDEARDLAGELDRL
jgi:trimethylamine--corrinoid protein Co-methyltransferase